MYKVPLAVVCLAAATSALKLSTDQGCCCHTMPCMSTCNNMCNDHNDDHQHDADHETSPLTPVIDDITECAEPKIKEIMEPIEKEINEQFDDPEEAANALDEIERQVTNDVIDDCINNVLKPPTDPEVEPTPTDPEVEPTPTDPEVEPTPTDPEVEPTPTDPEVEPPTAPEEPDLSAGIIPEVQTPPEPGLPFHVEPNCCTFFENADYLGQ